MEKRMIELHTADNSRRILIDIESIESIVERPRKYYVLPVKEPEPGTDPYTESQGCEINMKSGDKGKVEETYTQIVESILELLDGAGE